jgi:salicylate hydroxylase
MVIIADPSLKVGAGIQIPSNSSRILLKWGLGSFLGNRVKVEPEGMSFLRWEDREKIAYPKLVPDFRQNFDAPYFVIHRAHFHDALHQLALNLGVVKYTDSKVEFYDHDTATAHVRNGKSYSGDLIVAANGKTDFAKLLCFRVGDTIQGLILRLDAQFCKARMFLPC